MKQPKPITCEDFQRELLRKHIPFDIERAKLWNKITVPSMKQEYIFRPDGALHETRTHI